jgi:hypothetical protein
MAKSVRFTFQMVVRFPESEDRRVAKLRRRFRGALKEMKAMTTGAGRMVGGDLSSLEETVDVIERLASIMRRARASAFNAEERDGDGG